MKNKILSPGNLVLLVTMLFTSFQTVSAQQVSGLITDYQGFWKSGIGYRSSVKPQNSHNLLAFTFNGIQYSTGVNDELLSQNNELFFASDFRALPVKSINKANSNTKIGLGQLYDGVNMGKSVPSPVNDMVFYLTDGIKGLDIGTGVANLPAGNIEFDIDNFAPDAVGDGIPDILITQIADPSNSLDQYEFLDADGNRIGSRISINLQNITSVGTWTADFYEASTDPMILSAGFTNTDRDIRLWAADFSYFNISPSDIAKIKTFRVILSGSSDLAFVAYNYKTMQIGLPAVFGTATSKSEKNQLFLSWNMHDQTDVKKLFIEESKDGRVFYTIGEINQLNIDKKYHFNYKMTSEGKWFYRIKVISVNGKEIYSPIMAEEFLQPSVFKLFPNPAQNFVNLNIENNNSGATIEIRSLTGRIIRSEKIPAKEIRRQISLSGITSGVYSMVLITNDQRVTEMLVIK